MAQRDVKNRIASVKNIQKITRAMEMVAAARLRRAEQRIERAAPLRGRDPPDDAPGGRGRRERAARCRSSASTRPRRRVGAAARHRRPRPRGRVQLADHPRRPARRRASTRTRARTVVYYATGRRGVSSLTFRGLELGRQLHRLHRPARPTPNAREIAEDLMAAYVDGKVDRVEIFYNGYISPLTQEVAPRDAAAAAAGDDPRGGRATTRRTRERRAGHARARRVRARPGGDPPAAGARLRRDLDLPRAARVDRVRARRAHDRDAQRLRQRRRDDRRPDAAR